MDTHFLTVPHVYRMFRVDGSLIRHICTCRFSCVRQHKIIYMPIKVEMLSTCRKENLGFLVFSQRADPLSLSAASELLIKICVQVNMWDSQ